MLKDVIIQLLSDGRFLIFNTFTRSNIVCENDILILCQELITETDVLALIGKYKDRTFKVWDTEYFSNADGLLADPTRINWASLHEGDNSELNLDQTISLLLKKSILVEDVEQYRSRFRQKASHFDTNFGNFHQQLGYHLIFEQKINPAEWWLGQKFTEDYMVRFLLHNTLGAWWVHRHPDSPLNETFEYLRYRGVFWRDSFMRA